MDVVCQGRKKERSEREYIKWKICSEKHLRKCVDTDYKEPRLKILPTHYQVQGSG